MRKIGSTGGPPDIISFIPVSARALLSLQHFGETPVGQEPHQGDGHVKRSAEPRLPKCERDAGKIEQEGDAAFEVVAEGFRDLGVRAVVSDDEILQDEISNGGKEQHDSIQDGGQQGEINKSHPSSQ